MKASVAHCRGRSALAALILVSLLPLAAARAADPNWLEQPYNYLVVDQDVRGVLTEMGRNLSLPMVISEHVKGKVHGGLQADSASQFLTRIAAANGLAWYFDGNTLFVDSEQDLASQVFDTSGLNAAAVDTVLQRLAFNGERIALQVDPQQRSVTVSGPPSYLALVNTRLANIRPTGMARNSGGQERGVRVFRGGAETQLVSGH